MTTTTRNPGLIGRIAAWADRTARAYRRREATRLASQLPEYLQKDIGFRVGNEPRWPD